MITGSARAGTEDVSKRRREMKEHPRGMIRVARFRWPSRETRSHFVPWWDVSRLDITVIILLIFFLGRDVWNLTENPSILPRIQFCAWDQVFFFPQKWELLILKKKKKKPLKIIGRCTARRACGAWNPLINGLGRGLRSYSTRSSKGLQTMCWIFWGCSYSWMFDGLQNNISLSVEFQRYARSLGGLA